MASSVSGTPMWLFKFPWVNHTRYLRASTWASSSLVVVFPLEPVMPTTCTPLCRRYQVASSCKAVNTSSTQIQPATPFKEGASTSANTKPWDRAYSVKSLPLKEGLINAKNKDPGLQNLLSVVTFRCCK